VAIVPNPEWRLTQRIPSGRSGGQEVNQPTFTTHAVYATDFPRESHGALNLLRSTFEHVSSDALRKRLPEKAARPSIGNLVYRVAIALSRSSNRPMRAWLTASGSRYPGRASMKTSTHSNRLNSDTM